VASIYEGVEVRVFEYYSQHPYSLGILGAYKIHAAPSIAVNGNLICIGESPSKEHLSKVVEVAIKTRRFREKKE
jgi:hypothetical protein